MINTKVLKGTLAALLTVPFIWLCWLVWLDLMQPGLGLGADPGEAVIHHLGEWALRILLVAFSVSPLRRLFMRFDVTRATLGFMFARSRRMVGLFAYFYVSLHLLAYITFFLEFSGAALLEDFVERSYITAGIVAFFALTLMAATSTRGWQRRLRSNWAILHRLVYAAVALGLVHLWWLTRDGFFELVVYTLWFVVLLGERIAAKAAPTERAG